MLQFCSWDPHIPVGLCGAPTFIWGCVGLPHGCGALWDSHIPPNENYLPFWGSVGLPQSYGAVWGSHIDVGLPHRCGAPTCKWGSHIDVGLPHRCGALWDFKEPTWRNVGIP